MERRPSAAVARDSFEALFAAHYSRVVAIARKVLLDAHRAEDVAQEVFISFYHNSGPRDGDVSKAARWLHAAAVHASLNALRGDRRRAAREAIDARAQAGLQRITQDASNPQDIIESRERCTQVQSALKRLPLKYAAVLVLRHSGLSYAEIAAALDTGVNQVGTILARAEAQFKKEITRVSP